MPSHATVLPQPADPEIARPIAPSEVIVDDADSFGRNHRPRRLRRLRRAATGAGGPSTRGVRVGIGGNAMSMPGEGRGTVPIMAAPDDTSQDAYCVLIRELRRAGPEARVFMAADMSDAIRQLCLAGIRRRHPELDDGQAEQALRLRLLGTVANTPRA